MKKVFLLACLLCSLQTFSQKVEGNWYGKADVALTGSYNNYLLELNIRQDGQEVQGVLSYYFRDTYQSFYVRGTYNKSTRLLTIKNIPLTYHNSTSVSGVECPMDLEAIMTASRAQSLLQGVFRAHTQYRYTCPDINMTLQLGSEILNTDSIVDQFSSIKKLWKPTTEDFVVRMPESQPEVAKPTPAQPVVTPEVIRNQQTIQPDAVTQNLRETFEKRQNILIRELEVESDSVRVTFYDNGDIDGDSISVFYNRLPIVTQQGLDARGLNLFVQLDPSRPYNELSMFAQNLGTIPPNTALMVVTDGINRFEVFLSSSFTQNSSVRIRRKKSP